MEKDIQITNPEVSIIVPVYNEAENIAGVVDRLKSVQGIEMEIVVVDDGSSDDTWKVLQTLDGIVKLRHEVNQGKGSAIRTALPHTKGKAIIIQDADLEYYPEQIPDIVKPIINGEETAVYGSRFMKTAVPSGMKFPHLIANKLLGLTTRLLYGQKITDVCTCYKAFNGEALRSTPLQCKRFEFCMEVTAKFCLRGVKIKEMPIDYKARSVEQGKKIRWWDTFIMIGSLIKNRFTKN